MSTHNIGFYEDLTKIIFELSSNTHLISSTDINKIKFDIQLNKLCHEKTCFLFVSTGQRPIYVKYPFT